MAKKPPNLKKTREERLAAALRENLKRRKAAQRDRSAAATQDEFAGCAGGQSRVGVAAACPPANKIRT